MDPQEEIDVVEIDLGGLTYIMRGSDGRDLETR